MALLYQVECVGLCIFTFILLSLARTNWYRLDECNTSHSIHSVEGAIIDSQDGAYYTTDSRNCSLIFQTLGQPSTFLIKILHIDIRSDTIFCRDQLSLTELYNLTSTSSVILDRFCGDSTQLPIPNVVYTQGSYLRLKWVTGTGSSGHRGFSISLTAVSHDPVVCAAKGKFQCDNFTCIGQSLVCDGTSNCLHGEDETDCVNSQLADFQARGNSVMFSSTTTIPSTTVKLSAGSTTEQPKANEVYLWLPLIVVVIFTGIMVTLIMVGRRGEDSPYDRTSDEHNRLQLEMNANAGYEHSEGMPETPPPTYDAIARQTSYVSHISQTSDQISIPPEYEEAVEWSNEHGRQRQSRLRHVTRSRSAGRSTGMGTSSSGSRGPNFARLFSRSVSVTTSAHGVDRSGSVTTQNTTTSTSDNNTTELSSVFADTSPEIVIHPAPLPRPASHPLMSTPQTMHQGIPPPPTEVIGDDDVFDDSHQEETPSTQDSQNPTASDNFHPSFFL